MIYAPSFAVFTALCFAQLGVCQKATPTPPAKNEGSGHGCERVTCPYTGGVPGIPGANGMPGMPGPYGARGDKGDSGNEGKPGSKGDRGPKGILGSPGAEGPRGDKGDRGARGQNGYPGKTGPDGANGNKGEEGNPGTKGDAGEKGDQGSSGAKGDAAAAAGPISAANWKQCVWKKEDGRDSGKIKECSFNKFQDNTALKVSFQGNMRVFGDNKCSRWYFKFNGNECSGPMTIEAVVYNNWSSGNPNLHHHRSFEGYCENLPRGVITMELWVGSCSGQTQGEAHTGWNSVSRIMVEEVPRSQ